VKRRVRTQEEWINGESETDVSAKRVGSVAPNPFLCPHLYGHGIQFKEKP